MEVFMREKKIAFLICILFVFSSGTSIFASTDYIDDNGCYYAQTSDQVPVWEIVIEHLGLVKNTGDEVTLISSSTSAVNIADPAIAAGGVAGYFSQNLEISPGTYTQIHFRQGGISTLRGCIYDPVEEKYRATPDGTLYDTKEEALSNSGNLSLTYDSVEDEYLAMDPTVTISEGETYTLTILWKNYGLEAGIPEEGEPEGNFGVGLVWDPDTGEFSDGMLKDTYTLE